MRRGTSSGDGPKESKMRSPSTMNQVPTRTGEATIRQLTEEECRDRLATATVGRVGYVTPQGLQILPVSYRSAGPTLMLRTMPRSSLAQLGEMGRPVTFEVDDHDPDFELAWSVMMHGSLRELNEDGIQRLGELDPPVEPWPGDVASHPLEFVPHEFAGRVLEHRWTS